MFVACVAQHRLLEAAPLEDRRPLCTSAGREVHPDVPAAVAPQEYIDFIAEFIDKQCIGNPI